MSRHARCCEAFVELRDREDIASLRAMGSVSGGAREYRTRVTGPLRFFGGLPIRLHHCANPALGHLSTRVSLREWKVNAIGETLANYYQDCATGFRF